MSEPTSPAPLVVWLQAPPLHSLSGLLYRLLLGLEQACQAARTAVAEPVGQTPASTQCPSLPDRGLLSTHMRQGRQLSLEGDQS
jgi:hypothetical protein